MTEGIYLLLGSNMGDKRQQLETSCQKISAQHNIVKQSKIYETAAWGNTDQPSFYNQVIEITTTVEPEELLNSILGMEEEMGRVREVKWGQRIIDIDILYYNSSVINTDKLTIPHPEISNRRFTLVPLVEIAGDFVHPEQNENQRELLQACKDELKVMIV
jgi:2-amino-4-hydroxy-6-hydroxymethyldihydropteridine diphosphokinase